MREFRTSGSVRGWRCEVPAYSTTKDVENNIKDVKYMDNDVIRKHSESI